MPGSHVATEDLERPFDRVERCDACPAAAHVGFIWWSDQAGDWHRITLCRHHARQHHERITRLGRLFEIELERM